MKKLNKTTSVLFAMALAASFISGCGNPSKSESSTSATSSVSSKSISESSTESSQESSDESSSESSAKSSAESSGESSAESSKSVSESSVESSNESSEIPVYQVEPKKASFDNVTRYGKVLKTAELKSKDNKTARILKDYLVSILNVNDSTYDLYWCGYSITVDSSLIELFDEDYKPDFSLRYWQGIEEKYRNLG